MTLPELKKTRVLERNENETNINADPPLSIWV